MTSQTTSERSLGQRMGLAALLLAASTLLSRLLGVLREAVIAYQHGATAMTDAYHAAYTPPDLIDQGLCPCMP